MPDLFAFTDSVPLGKDDPAVNRFLQGMAMLNLYREAELPAQAERVAEQIASTPEGRRAITPFYILAFELKASEYKVDALGIYERGWIDVTRDTTKMGELAWRLQRRGISLDFIYCDLEVDLSPWTLGQERFVEIYKSEAAMARMPEKLRGFDPKALKFLTPEYRAWINELGNYAERIRMDGLRKSLCDSGLLSPWAGQTTAVNYGSFRPSFPVYDLNGWGNGANWVIDERTGCPVAYPGLRGGRYVNRAHHPVWNSFIDCLNYARSASPMGEIVPVIREPLRARGQAKDTVDPGARWLSDQLIGHLTRTGARRFVVFNAGATAADDIAIARILESHNGATPNVNPTLPEIPLDVDEIVTGDFKTNYTDFVRHEPERWVDPG